MHGAERALVSRRGSAFTLVELLIVTTILAILAMIVVPHYAQSADDARDSALESDLQAARKQIELYRLHHVGRGPETNELGQLDTANLIQRLTGKTDKEGAIDANGAYGPYLLEWPGNPFISSSADSVKILFGKNPSPRDGTTGWYYNWQTSRLHVNSPEGAESIDP